MSVAVISRQLGQRVIVGDAEVRIQRVEGKRVTLAITTVKSSINRPSKDQDKADRESARKAWINAVAN